MIADNIKRQRERIAAVCERVGRNPQEICLLAVSKSFSAGMVREALDAGISEVGENYVQELLPKQKALEDRKVQWHFIGHLQSNKVKSIAGWIHMIQTVDSISLGEQIARRAREAERAIEVLMEVNTSGEPGKFGVLPGEAPALARRLAGLQNLRLSGFMTIGPLLPDPESARPAFRMLRRLRDSLAAEGLVLPHLSMGMTNDLEIAIEEGSTIVRIGTGIFGKRIKKQ
jgi:hypothetical protein